MISRLATASIRSLSTLTLYHKVRDEGDPDFVQNLFSLGFSLPDDVFQQVDVASEGLFAGGR